MYFRKTIKNIKNIFVSPLIYNKYNEYRRCETIQDCCLTKFHFLKLSTKCYIQKTLTNNLTC
jgi:hypothetical protein